MKATAFVWKYGKEVTGMTIFTAVGLAPYVVPAVFPEALPFIIPGQALFSVLGAALLGAPRWTNLMEKYKCQKKS
jgi:hypothetical protein